MEVKIDVFIKDSGAGEEEVQAQWVAFIFCVKWEPSLPSEDKCIIAEWKAQKERRKLAPATKEAVQGLREIQQTLRRDTSKMTWLIPPQPSGVSSDVTSSEVKWSPCYVLHKTKFPLKTYNGVNLALVCGIMGFTSTPSDRTLSEVGGHIYLAHHATT